MLQDLSAFYAEHGGLFVVLIFVLGLLVGSFLNVVIYRLPIILERQWRSQATELLSIDAEASFPVASVASVISPQPRFSLSVPRSACPRCGAPIAAWQNIPVISWLVLRGRCHACRAPISPRYPLVELATALISALVAWHFLGAGTATVCALLLSWALIALTGIDIDHQLLPDDITLPLMWTGLVAAVVFGVGSAGSIPVAPAAAVLGAAGGYLSLWLVFHAFRLVTGKEGMGYGDFKLFAALGAWLGWQMLPVIILLASATGAVLGIAMIVLKGRDRATPMPFGPYLAIAGWLAMMYGNVLLDGYLRMSGLQH